MSSNINFLLNKNSDLVKQKKGLKIIRIASVVVLVVVTLLSIVVFFLNRSLYPASLKKEQESIVQSMNFLRNREAKLTVVNNRIENISSILNERLDYYKVISTLLQKLPDGVFVERIKVDKKTILLSVSSSSLLPISEFINNLIDMAKEKEIISALTLDFLTIDQKTRSSYSVSLTANL